MKGEDINNICKIYKEMTYDGHKPKEGLEKARCMLFAHKYYEEMKEKTQGINNDGRTD